MATNSGDDDEAAYGVDLFGCKITPIRERRGRPSFTKNNENQELVALLVAANWSQARISRYLGCDEKTLRKHFSRELDAGADMIEGMALEVTLKQLRSGKSPAVKRMLDIIEKARLTPPSAPKPKPEKLGKKEQTNRDAQTAHERSGWNELLQ